MSNIAPDVFFKFLDTCSNLHDFNEKYKALCELEPSLAVQICQNYLESISTVTNYIEIGCDSQEYKSWAIPFNGIDVIEDFKKANKHEAWELWDECCDYSPFGSGEKVWDKFSFLYFNLTKEETVEIPHVNYTDIQLQTIFSHLNLVIV